MQIFVDMKKNFRSSMTKERQQDSNGKSEIDMMRSCEKRGQKIATIVII